MKRCKADMGDRISDLPDEILADILSRLTMREAIGTSVLSRRWKDVWTYTTSSFDFDFGSKVMSLNRNQLSSKFLKAERKRYISSVNKILRAHKGSTIEALKVEFDLNSRHKSNIDSWINFAIRKKARRLELHLNQTVLSETRVRWNKFYVFPAATGDPNMITTLKLCNVNVTGRVFKYLLSNFLSLECLCIKNSNCLVLATVVAPCPKLKHLEISKCFNLEYLDIYSAPNLTSFYYSGIEEETRLCLRDVPNLVDVSLGGSYCVGVVDRFHELAIPLSQIQKLKLCLNTISSQRFPGFYNFPELKNVRQLELQTDTLEKTSLVSCVSVMEACPNLCRFSMHFHWSFYDHPNSTVEQELQHWENGVIHKCLKVVEFVWFRGRRIDEELATAILSNAPFLEKIIVDTRITYPDRWRNVSEDRLAQDKVSAEECAKRLAQQLCPTALVVIL